MSEKNKEILFIAIGGTIDSVERTWERPKCAQRVTMLEKSPAVEYVNDISKDPDKCKSQDKFSFSKENFPKTTALQYEKFADSADFTGDDLISLSAFIKEKGIKNVIITCGTDFMIPLSKKLEDIFKDNNDKVIQITGAMTPLANGLKRNDKWDVTDGHDNINFAINKVINNELTPGCYISFHGKTLVTGENPHKDYDSGQFVSEKEFYKKYVRPIAYKGIEPFVKG